MKNFKLYRYLFLVIIYLIGVFLIAFNFYQIEYRKNLKVAEKSISNLYAALNENISQRFLELDKILEDLYINFFFSFKQKKKLSDFENYLSNLRFPYSVYYIKNIYSAIGYNYENNQKIFSLLENKILDIDNFKKSKPKDFEYLNQPFFIGKQFKLSTYVFNQKKYFKNFFLIKSDYLDAKKNIVVRLVIQGDFYEISKPWLELFKINFATWLLQSEDEIISNIDDFQSKESFIKFINQVQSNSNNLSKQVKIKNKDYLFNRVEIFENKLWFFVNIKEPEILSYNFFFALFFYSLFFSFAILYLKLKNEKNKFQLEKNSLESLLDKRNADFINVFDNKDKELKEYAQNVEKKLLENLKFQEQIFDLFDNPALVFDKNFNFLKANLSAIEKFGANNLNSLIISGLFSKANLSENTFVRFDANIINGLSIEERKLAQKIADFQWKKTIINLPFIDENKILLIGKKIVFEDQDIEDSKANIFALLDLCSSINIGLIVFDKNGVVLQNQKAKEYFNDYIKSFDDFCEIFSLETKDKLCDRLKKYGEIELKKINSLISNQTLLDIKIKSLKIKEEEYAIVLVEDKTLFYKLFYDLLISEAKLTAASKLSEIIVFIIDEKGNIEKEKYFSYSPNDVEKCRENILSDENFIQALSEAKLYNNSRITTVINNKEYFSVIIEPYISETNEFKYVVAINNKSKISYLENELQNLRKEIKEKEQLLKGFYFEAVLRPQFQLLSLSESAYELFNLEKKEAVIADIDFINSFENEDFVKALTSKIILPLEKITYFKSKITDKNSTIRYFEIAALTKIEENNFGQRREIIKAFAYNIDEMLTLESSAEDLKAKYEILFSNDMIGIIFYNLNTLNIITSNNKADLIFESNKKKKLNSIFISEQIDMLLRNENFVYSKEKPNSNIEYYEIHSIRNDVSKLGGIICFDITKMKTAEENFIRYQQNLERAIKERTMQLLNTNKSLLKEFEKQKLIEKRIERQISLLNDLINLTPLPIFLKKFNGELIAANKKFFEFIELKNKEINIFGSEFIFSNKLLLEIKNAEEKIYEYNKICQFETVYTDKNGILRELELTAIRIPEFEDYNDVILGIIQDITKQKEAQRRIQEALQKEKELSDLKSRFISMASHEFRTPLTAILSSTEIIEMLIKKQNYQKALEHINKIKASVKLTANIMNDALFFNKAEMGKIVIKNKKIVFKEFIKDLIEELLIGTYSGREIETYIRENFILYSDKNLIRQILSNLLNNALKYSQSKVTFYARKINDHKAIFIVRDRGIGIPKKDLPNLFQPFFRAENVDGIKGTGLGLAIVKKAVEELKGEIKVKTKENFGTAFFVILPKNNELKNEPKEN